MKKAIMAKKIGMTQIFDQETGEMIPVTVLEAGPCCVTQVKTVEHDGYAAIQVGFGEIREKLVNKPLKGHFAKAGVSVKRHVEEFKIEGAEGFEGFTGGFLNVGGDAYTTTWDFYITAPDDRDIVMCYFNRGFGGDAEYGLPAQEGHPVDDTAVYGANVNFVDNLDWFNQYKDWVVLSKNS